MARPKHNPEIVKAIQESITGAETGVAQAGDTVYNDCLPEDLTPEVVQKVSDYTTVFVASGQEAAGNAALAALKKDKKLESVSVNLPMGAFGQTDYTIHRSKEVTIPPAEKGGEATKEIQYGVNRCNVSFVAGKNSGLLAKARDSIKESATEMFGKTTDSSGPKKS